MSYYGYPNPTAYNYQAYAAYAAAGAQSYDQYAAYNAAAYRAMQGGAPGAGGAAPQAVNKQPGGAAIPPPPPGGISISQPAQRYDYAKNAQQYYAAAAAASYPAAAMKPPQQQQQQQGQKWPMPGIPFTTTPGQLTGGTNTAANNNKRSPFNKQRRPGPPQQMFYCEVCKISCAGPQTYKEHLDGQKHKKREVANKANEKKSPQPGTATATAADSTTPSASTNTNGTSQTTTNVGNSNNNSFNRGRFARTQNIIKCELCDVACTGRDAYAAHLRGTKHQKTLKLHQKLGKPIPPDVITASTTAVASIKSQAQVQPQPQQTQGPQQMPAGFTYPQATVIQAPPCLTAGATQAATAAAASVIASSSTVVKTQANGTTTAAPVQSTDVGMSGAGSSDMNVDDDGDSSNHEPIGREYIETRMEGKILTFYCKLCDCKFNDPNAKDMHTKGRRHRLAYKKKVDPNLKVDLKGVKHERVTKPTRPLMKPMSSIRERMVKPLMNQNGTNFNAQQQQQQIAPSSSGGGLKPLMSSSDSKPAMQTIQQLMSQPIQRSLSGQFNPYASGHNQQTHRHHETFDDKHIVARHNSIYPTQEEISAIQDIVTSTEKALKLVSDQIAQEDATSTSIKSETMDNDSTKQTGSVLDSNEQFNLNQDSDLNQGDKQLKEDKQRALKGVMRVGLLAKGLLLRGDTDVKLIVICANKPTKSLLERVHKILLQKIEVVSPDVKYSIILDKEAETILIVRLTINEVQPLITCRILLTSPAVRSGPEEEQTDKLLSTTESNDDLLDKQKCLDSLADLRHAKWFQAKASQVNNCVVIIRILRDLCRRNPTWSPLSQWALELLVESSLNYPNQSLSPGEALRRVLECVSSGILLPSGNGLYDPCEKDPKDAAENLKNQQREEITASAQMALRLLAFKQIYKILGMECLTFSNANATATNRFAKKRQHEPSENEPDSHVEEKKEKKDDNAPKAQ